VKLAVIAAAISIYCNFLYNNLLAVIVTANASCPFYDAVAISIAAK